MFLWRRSSWIPRKSFPTWLRIVAAEWRNPCAVNLQAGVEAAGAPKDLSLAATHADLYDKPESVGPTVAKLKDFYSEYLA